MPAVAHSTPANSKMRGLTQIDEAGEQRYQRNRQAGDKRGLGGCGELQPNGLKQVTGEQAPARNQPAARGPVPCALARNSRASAAVAILETDRQKQDGRDILQR